MSQLQGVNTSEGPIRFLIRTWVGGATMSHLSFGMTALGMRGATFFRVLSVFMRMGAASAIVVVHADQTALRLEGPVALNVPDGKIPYDYGPGISISYRQTFGISRTSANADRGQANDSTDRDEDEPAAGRQH